MARHSPFLEFRRSEQAAVCLVATHSIVRKLQPRRKEYLRRDLAQYQYLREALMAQSVKQQLKTWTARVTQVTHIAPNDAI